MMLLMFLWFFAFLVGLALVVWWILNRLNWRERLHAGREDQALTALRERFARGEIDEQEYQQRRQILERDHR